MSKKPPAEEATTGAALPPEARIGIGAVARLTGMSVDALRKWEQRHGVVTPIRSSSNQRLYTQTDVGRLKLIRRLADGGVPIADIATLDLEALEGLGQSLAESLGSEAAAPAAQTRAAARPGDAGRHLRAAVSGDSLPPALLKPGTRSGRFEVTASAPTLDALPYESFAGAVDLLIVELPSVQLGSADAIRDALERAGTRHAVVVYGFGAREVLRALGDLGVVLLRAPLDMGQLTRATSELRRPELPDDDELDIPPVRFGGATIARVAAMSPSIECECPNHLAEIIMRLRAFEHYSAACKDSDPEQAALHRFLLGTAANSRAAFENALVRVAEVEGIELAEA